MLCDLGHLGGQLCSWRETSLVLYPQAARPPPPPPSCAQCIQADGGGPRGRAWDPVPTAYFLQLPPGSFLVLVPRGPALLMFWAWHKHVKRSPSSARDLEAHLLWKCHHISGVLDRGWTYLKSEKCLFAARLPVLYSNSPNCSLLSGGLCTSEKRTWALRVNGLASEPQLWHSQGCDLQWST